MGGCCSSTGGPVRPREAAHERSALTAGIQMLETLRQELEAVASTAQEPALAQTLAQSTLGKDFSFAGRRFLAKVVDVYDGDTVRVCFFYRGELVQYRARMAGYDSPEMKPPKADPNREAEKAAAVAARAALAEKAGGKLVYIECGEFDKYGRLLITAFAQAGARNGENINAWMLACGHGVPYDGGRKPPYNAA
jgi:endonuclease YncB( thermonuclease family)